jgi:hypothetical protein
VKRPPGAPELRFVLFDGEEPSAGCEPFVRCGIRGSRAYVERHGPQEIGGLILLDYVANKGAHFPREANSDVGTWTKLRRAAARIGVGGMFGDAGGASLIDDHTPFLQAGITAIDVIDYSYRDGPGDTLDKVSPVVLDAVGETVVELVRGLGAGRL